MFHSSTPEFVTNRILPPKWEKCTFLQSWFFKYPFNFDFGKKIARFPRNSIRITRFFQTRFNVLPTFQGTGSSVVPECTKLTWLELQQFFPKLSNKKIMKKKKKNNYVNLQRPQPLYRSYSLNFQWDQFSNCQREQNYQSKFTFITQVSDRNLAKKKRNL